ncbi:hypothetical protein BCR35DRAFT_330129 [Leucosporidium creatinivorum]|uniref:Uncharacterized protein n=1 Tax=Leucosporidium creatinivorum TaxID=106004 RepID=A0A1Y2FW52_9BASI|nr:hypothetical protein BCR35DRAFT_330129 [Leucosporidium creatinivorum]
MAASGYRPSDHFTTQLSQASQNLSGIFSTAHALSPPVEIELKRAIAELLEYTTTRLEHISQLDAGHALHEQHVLLQQFEEMKGRIIRAIHQRYQELQQQYVNARLAFDQAIDRRPLAPEVKEAAKAVLPSMPTGVSISNSYILAHIKDAQRKGQALLRVLLVAEKGE